MAVALDRQSRVRSASFVASVIRREAAASGHPITEAVPSTPQDWQRVALVAGVARLDTAGELLVLHDLGLSFTDLR